MDPAPAAAGSGSRPTSWRPPVRRAGRRGPPVAGGRARPPACSTSPGSSSWVRRPQPRGPARHRRPIGPPAGSAAGPRMARNRIGPGRRGARVVRRLPGVHGAAMRVPKRGAAPSGPRSPGRREARRRWRRGLAGRQAPARPRSQRAPDRRPGRVGGRVHRTGVTVAVLDTGIDATHPDFAGRIAEARDFTDGEPDPANDVGHGTHVASIMAGTGARRRRQSGRRARTPAADRQGVRRRLLPRVGDHRRHGVGGRERRAVVNLSLGGGPDRTASTRSSRRSTTLTAEHGTLFVVAAGNAGPAEPRSARPARADAALTVGAVDRTDELADFSSRGPRVGDDAVKPDITAPGVGHRGRPRGRHRSRSAIRSTTSTHGCPARRWPPRTWPAPPRSLAQQHPDWRAAELKAALMGRPRRPGAGVFDAGRRRRPARAIDQSSSRRRPASSLGIAASPHDDDEPRRSGHDLPQQQYDESGCRAPPVQARQRQRPRARRAVRGKWPSVSNFQPW